MNVRRTVYFQRALAILIILTGLSSQLQVVFACDLMDGQPKPVCCCGGKMSDGCAMGGGCGTDEEMAQEPDCCDVSVESLSDVAIAGATPTPNQVALQKTPQPPPLALCAVIASPQLEFGGVALPLDHPPDPHFVRTEVYLLTNRLRI